MTLYWYRFNLAIAKFTKFNVCSWIFVNHFLEQCNQVDNSRYRSFIMVGKKEFKQQSIVVPNCLYLCCLPTSTYQYLMDIIKHWMKILLTYFLNSIITCSLTHLYLIVTHLKEYILFVWHWHIYVSWSKLENINLTACCWIILILHDNYYFDGMETKWIFWYRADVPNS